LITCSITAQPNIRKAHNTLVPLPSIMLFPRLRGQAFFAAMFFKRALNMFTVFVTSPPLPKYDKHVTSHLHNSSKFIELVCLPRLLSQMGYDRTSACVIAETLTYARRTGRCWVMTYRTGRSMSAATATISPSSTA